MQSKEIETLKTSRNDQQMNVNDQQDDCCELENMNSLDGGA